MGYIYKYIDKADGITKYVGIVYEESRSLKQRILEHQRYDGWCSTSEWDIWYLDTDINSRTDAEYFEAHYISLYHTDAFYNKAKAGWGISKYLPDRENEWKLFDFNNADLNSTPADKFLDDFLNSDERGRMYLYNKYIENSGNGKRRNNKLLSSVNDLLNDKFGFSEEHNSSDCGGLVLTEGGIQFILPTLNNETGWYHLNYNGVVSKGRFSSDDFVSHARSYIQSITALIDKVENMVDILHETTNYFNAA